MDERGKPLPEQSWRWAKAAAESGRAQPHTRRALTAPTHSAGLLHFHPLIRYIYFLGISLTRIDCTIIAYFFGPLAVNLEARRAEAGRPSLSGLTPACAVGCHDNRDRCHPCRPRPSDGENRSCDGAAVHSHRPAKCSWLNHLFHLARRGKHKRNEMNLTSVFRVTLALRWILASASYEFEKITLGITFWSEMTLVMSTLQKHVISNVRYLAIVCYFLNVSGGYLHLRYISDKLF